MAGKLKVEYVGSTVTERRISKEDWEKSGRGGELDKDYVWPAYQEYRFLDLSGAPEEFVQYLRNDSDFRVTEDKPEADDEQGELALVPKPEKPTR